MLDKYQQAYLEEAREIVLELESAVLALDKSREDADLVARAFRALHTIKGSGAMFGFTAIAEFTHHLENAFDQVRNRNLNVSSELIALALSATDQIKSMLQEASGGDPADAAAGTTLLLKLRELMGTPPAASAPKAEAASAPPASPAGEEREWHIRFSPGPELIRYGGNPLLLLRELAQMGTLKATAVTTAIPPLGDLDPERCYVGWDLLLHGKTTADAILDVFIFVQDACELKVEPVATPPVELTPLGERRRHPGRRAYDKENASSIRVAPAKLDQLVDLVGQLVTVQAHLGELAGRRDDRELQAVSEEIESLTSSLRETSMGMRTVPLRPAFERFKRLVHDLGQTLHKDVELTFEGADTELDKTVIDQLSDPLMHLIRNSMDHGIEPAEVRATLGKPATGTVHLSARHAGAQVLVSVSDDGRGIDREAVRGRALEKGLISPDARLNDSEVFSLIMAPGFSTAREVTDLSGRGVGMDVVRKNVESLRGSIEISSQPGAGATVTLRLPLTLAIIDGLLVRVGDTRFVMPLANTVECVELSRQDIEAANGKHLANIRGEIVPYVRLSEYLQIPGTHQEREQVMVAETEHGRFGFVVDEVLGDNQTVIKNLGRLFRSVTELSGATILGDGSVALILDLHRLAHNVIRNGSLHPGSPLRGPRQQPYQES